MFYTYVLKSQKDGKMYIGSTNDLKRRLLEHNNGKSFSTKNRRPLILIYYEAYYSLSDARTRETKLKKFKNSYTELKKRLQCSLEEIEHKSGAGVNKNI